MSKKEIPNYAYNRKEVPEGALDYLSVRDLVQPEYVERMHIDREGIDELAENIKKVGLINPLLVKKKGDKWEVVAGHRRLKALIKLGAAFVKCTVTSKDKLDTDYMKLSENLYRQDLTDLEEAQMLDHLKRLGKVSELKLGKDIGKSESYVRQKLAILKYPERLKAALADGTVTFSVARELIRLKNENMINEYTRHAITNGVTPALAKQWVDDILTAEKADKKEKKVFKDGHGNLQVQQPSYICYACEAKATTEDSGLFRIHHKCAEILKEQG